MSKLRIVLRIILGLMLIGMIWIGYRMWAKSSPDYFWTRAQAAESAGHLEAAKIHLQSMVRRFPDHGEARKSLAAVLLELSRKNNGPASYAANPEALTQLNEAARLRPDDLQLQKELLVARLDRAQMKDASDVAARVVKHEPNNPDALFALAWQAVKIKNARAAQGPLNKLKDVPQRRFQTMALALQNAADQRDTAKQQEIAASVCAQAVKLTEDELAALPAAELATLRSLLVRAPALAASAETAQSHASDAVTVLEKLSARIDPKDQKKRNTVAVEAAQIVSILGSQQATALEGKAGAALVERIGKLQTAAVEAGGAAPIVYQQLAWQAFTQGDFRRAVDTLSQGLEAHKNLPAPQRGELIPLHLLASKSLLALRRYEDAGREAQAVLQTPGVSKDAAGRALLLAGTAASAAGRHEAALELHRRAEQTMGQTPEVRIALASSLLTLRKWQEALAHLNALQAVFNVRDEEQQFLAKQHQLTQLMIRWNQLRAHLALKQWKEAQPHLQALQGTPLETRSQAVAAVYLWSQNQRRQAQTLLDAARQKKPDDLLLNQVQVAFLQQAGRGDDAEQLVEHLAESAPNDLNKQLMRVHWRIQQGKREEAAKLIEELTPRFPDASSLQLLKAQNLIALGKNDEALKVAEELRKNPATTALGALVATAVEFQEKDLAGAEKQLEALAGHAPQHGAVRLLQGEVAAAQGDYAAAVDSLGEALDVTAMRSRAQQTLLRSFVLMAEKEGPAAAYQRLLPLVKEHPDDPFLLIIQADLLFKQGQFEQGMALVDRAEQLQPQQPEAPYIKASLWLQRGQGDRALAEVQRALTLAPQHLPSLALAAKLNLAAGKPQDALKQVRAALTQSPQLWDLYLTQAEALVQLKQSDKAVTLLEKVIEQQPKFVQAHRTLAAVHASRQELDEALEVCRRARETLPDDLALATDEVALLCRQDKMAEAQKVAESVAGDPPSVDRALTLAQVFSGVREWEAARNWAERAMALATDEQKPAIHLFLGEVALLEDRARPDAKHKEAARSHFAAVLEKHPQHFVAGNNLAWLLATAFDRPQEAAEIVDRVRGEASVGQLPVNFLDTLAVVYRKAGRAADAERILKQAVDLAPDNPLLLYHRGLALADLGRGPAAQAELTRALELGLPADKETEARQALARLETSEQTSAKDQ